MRKIIAGRTYNTETSKVIGNWDNRLGRGDHAYCDETLYKNSKGAYFIHGEGGGRSRYAKSCGQNSWTGGQDIKPLTIEEAREWAEKYLDANEYEDEFGEAEEAEPESDLTTRERVNLTLGNETINLLRNLSAESGVPMARMVDKAVRAMYGAE